MGRKREQIKPEIEKCKVTFVTNSPTKNFLVSYMGEGGSRIVHGDLTQEIEVEKGTTISLFNWTIDSKSDIGAERLFYNNKNAIYKINADTILTYI